MLKPTDEAIRNFIDSKTKTNTKARMEYETEKIDNRRQRIRNRKKET